MSSDAGEVMEVRSTSDGGCVLSGDGVRVRNIPIGELDGLPALCFSSRSSMYGFIRNLEASQKIDTGFEVRISVAWCVE